MRASGRGDRKPDLLSYCTPLREAVCGTDGAVCSKRMILVLLPFLEIASRLKSPRRRVRARDSAAAVVKEISRKFLVRFRATAMVIVLSGVG